MREDSQPNLMLDPSILASEAAIAWLEEEDVARRIVVSDAFMRWLEGRGSTMFWPFGESNEPSPDPSALSPLFGLLESSERFSSRQGVYPADFDAPGIQGALLSGGGLEGEILADELMFLLSRSWIGARTRGVLSAFERAGADVLTLGRSTSYAFRRGMERQAGLDPSSPPPSLHRRTADSAELPPADIVMSRSWRRVGGKWLVTTTGGATGAAVGALIGGPLGAAVGAAGGATLGTVILGIDP